MDQKLKVLAGSLLLVAAGAAQAALPSEATAAFASILSDATDLIKAAWPVAVAVVGGLILIKLFKRVMSGAT